MSEQRTAGSCHRCGVLTHDRRWIDAGWGPVGFCPECAALANPFATSPAPAAGSMDSEAWQLLCEMVAILDRSIKRRSYEVESWRHRAFTLLSSSTSAPATGIGALREATVSTDRDALGRLVRETWIAYCRETGDTKPSHVAPWEELSEWDKEVDRRIGEAVVAAFQSTPPPPSEEATFHTAVRELIGVAGPFLAGIGDVSALGWHLFRVQEMIDAAEGEHPTAASPRSESGGESVAQAAVDAFLDAARRAPPDDSSRWRFDGISWQHKCPPAPEGYSDMEAGTCLGCGAIGPPESVMAAPDPAPPAGVDFGRPAFEREVDRVWRGFAGKPVPPAEHKAEVNWIGDRFVAYCRCGWVGDAWDRADMAYGQGDKHVRDVAAPPTDPEPPEADRLRVLLAWYGGWLGAQEVVERLGIDPVTPYTDLMQEVRAEVAKLSPKRRDWALPGDTRPCPHGREMATCGECRQAGARATLDRLPVINDPVITEAMAALEEDDRPEGEVRRVWVLQALEDGGIELHGVYTDLDRAKHALEPKYPNLSAWEPCPDRPDCWQAHTGKHGVLIEPATLDDEPEGEG